MKQALAIIGSGSMIGSQFYQQAQADFGLVRADLPEVDITKSDLVESFFKNNNFQWAILFSAITDVMAIEKERDYENGPTWQVNVEGTRNVAEACKKYSRGLIFISTDFVFDGVGGPHSEDDPTGPNRQKVTWYGITKIEGENLVRATLSKYIILRISYPYSGKDTGKEDLVLRDVRGFESGELYKMYDDQTITPTYIPDIEPAVSLLLRKNFTGTIHLASPITTTQYEFSSVLIEKAGVKGPHPLERKSIREDTQKPQAVPRPKDGGLRVDKIKSLGFAPTDWRQGIDKSIALWLK
ncbi:NAD(P)-dependent oxidoreductase [Candidatus Curtissbacteria bacterium]|nr:NAD(P)-dependent oxidoreductase [Candidatus Curtissbacteria bacterium]